MKWEYIQEKKNIGDWFEEMLKCNGICFYVNGAEGKKLIHVDCEFWLNPNVYKRILYIIDILKTSSTSGPCRENTEMYSRFSQTSNMTNDGQKPAKERVKSLCCKCLSAFYL